MPTQFESDRLVRHFWSSLFFGLRSRHDCWNTTISFVLLSVGTIWAAKHRTNITRKLQDYLQIGPRTHTICFYACKPPREITWRDVTSEMGLYIVRLRILQETFKKVKWNLKHLLILLLWRHFIVTHAFHSRYLQNNPITQLPEKSFLSQRLSTLYVQLAKQTLKIT